jgi:hypothetical protein
MQGAGKYALYFLMHPANAPNTIAASAVAGARRFGNEIDNALYRGRRVTFVKYGAAFGRFKVPTQSYEKRQRPARPLSQQPKNTSH